MIEWHELRSNLRPSTERIYEHNLKAHVLPSLGSIELATLKRDDVRRFVGEARA